MPVKSINFIKGEALREIFPEPCYSLLYRLWPVRCARTTLFTNWIYGASWVSTSFVSVPKLVHQASCSRNVFSFGSASKINFLPRWETLSVFLIACLSTRVVSYLDTFSTKHAAILVSTKCLLPLVICSAPGMFRWGFLQSPHLVVSYVLTSGSTMF